MIDIFNSPRLTLGRAHHHIRDLKKQIDAFTYEKPWSNVMEDDQETQQQSLKIRFTRRLPSELPCIVFDAASNLRAVLDQCGYASAVASGKSAPKKAYFPFGDDLSGLNNNIEGRGVCICHLKSRRSFGRSTHSKEGMIYSGP